jgi:translation initiation factor 4A
VIDPASNSL